MIDGRRVNPCGRDEARPERSSRRCCSSTASAPMGARKAVHASAERAPRRSSSTCPELAGLRRRAAPYRPSTSRAWPQPRQPIGLRRVDVAGVSWGGGIAQQFAHQHYLDLSKARAGRDVAWRDHGSRQPAGVWKMATPRRYIDKDFMRRVAPEIYGGAFRSNPDLSSPRQGHVGTEPRKATSISSSPWPDGQACRGFGR